jgi:hypothetical protein
MSDKIDIHAYHGTYSSAAQDIVKNNFTISTRDDNWLGQGVYFYREDPEQALTWAVVKIKQNNALGSLLGESAQVIKTIIQIDENCFLNIDTRSGFFKFQDHFFSVKSQIPALKVKSNGSEGKKKIRCFVMDLLPEDIKVIQNSFHVQSKRVLKYLEDDLDICLFGTQICVRDINLLDKSTFTMTKSRKIFNNQMVVSRRKPIKNKLIKFGETAKGGR